MSEIEPPYPPAPKDVPVDLAKPGFHYRLMVAFVLLALLLFLVIYLALNLTYIYAMTIDGNCLMRVDRINKAFFPPGLLYSGSTPDLNF